MSRRGRQTTNNKVRNGSSEHDLRIDDVIASSKMKTPPMPPGGMGGMGDIGGMDE